MIKKPVVREPMEFCEYIHMLPPITKKIDELYKKGMELKYIWFHIEFKFNCNIPEEDIASIIEFNRLTEIYD